jgi:uncharacterized membrane protein
MIQFALPLALHALAAVLWIGGMAFAYGILRPAAGVALEVPQRLALWRGVFARFFPTVWVAVAILLITGYLMVFTRFAGFAASPPYIHAMHALGLAMTALFAHVFFAPWRRFRTAVDTGDHQRGAAELARIRRLVAINLGLGILIVVVGASGRLWPI